MVSCSKPNTDVQITFNKHDLVSTTLAKSWDEGIPLGNGMIGALVWQKEDKLRFSLDRADLWDLRPMDIKNKEEWKYSWIVEQRKKGTFHEVINKLDRIYDDNPAPTKIPGAALEFNIAQLGEVEHVRLSILDAVCKVKWKNNTELTTFVNGAKNVGWFRFEGVDANFSPVISPPNYDKGDLNKEANSLNTQDLITLGYTQGNVTKTPNSQYYIQEGWGGFKYHVYVEWKYINNGLEGCWSITSEYPKWEKKAGAIAIVKGNMNEGYKKQFVTHKAWWKTFWEKSKVNVPDPIIEKQWYLEQYKFGSAARKDAPPISLQAVWTADNGTIPPWKGDYHHDLNTQLSYWPAYSGNHLDLEEGFLNWLWRYRGTFKKFTRDFFETNGMNVPGTTSLDGIGMGGWSQYAYTPTASAWLSHHFYLHWRYSMDREFLKERAYPWIKDVAVFLEELSEEGADGKLKLPLSSSPEIFNNEAKAWFYEITNYDLALMRWTFEKASELALELGEVKDSKRWKTILLKLPEYAVDSETGLMYAPGFPCSESHRHFSQLMAIHPLGTIDWSQGKASQEIIINSVKNLKTLGTDWWTGYSFSWLANIQARMYDGEAAAKTLRIFAENFCLPNSFHVNGEQYNKGYSKFKYRPFTLEGNFAFAAAVQEMLVQSHTGIVQVFPAIPDDWADVSFDTLRAEGAFLVSGKKEAGEVVQVSIHAEKGGVLKLKNPFGDRNFILDATYTLEDGIIIIQTQANQKINIIADEV
nr:glycoside hydrolase family 95 protein [Snuella sedimenti]